MTSDVKQAQAIARIRSAGRLVRQVRMAYYELNHIFLFSGIEVNGNSGAFSIMTDIYFQGPKTIPELLEERAITRQSIHRMIQRLKADGILDYMDNPEHKRSKKIVLTPYGEEYFLSKLETLDQVMAPVAQALSDEQLDEGYDTLLKVRSGLKQYIDDMEPSDS